MWISDLILDFCFFFSSRRRHTRCLSDWSSDVCSSDLISTGFVVDDAIVMIENISRFIEEGMSPMQAALKGSEQIGFTIMSLTVSLIAVLIPLLFMSDVVGRLFRE